MRTFTSGQRVQYKSAVDSDGKTAVIKCSTVFNADVYVALEWTDGMWTIDKLADLIPVAE